MPAVRRPQSEDGGSEPRWVHSKHLVSKRTSWPSKEFLPSAVNQGVLFCFFLSENRNKDLPEPSIQMCHRSRRERVDEDAGDALEVGHAAQADPQTDAGLCQGERRQPGGLRTELQRTSVLLPRVGAQVPAGKRPPQTSRCLSCCRDPSPALGAPGGLALLCPIFPAAPEPLDGRCLVCPGLRPTHRAVAAICSPTAPCPDLRLTPEEGSAGDPWVAGDPSRKVKEERGGGGTAPLPFCRETSTMTL